MQWMNCCKCKNQFVEGYFTEDALEIIFHKTHENQRKVSAKIIEKVLAYKSAGTWQDISFGNGSFFLLRRSLDLTLLVSI